MQTVILCTLLIALLLHNSLLEIVTVHIIFIHSELFHLLLVGESTNWESVAHARRENFNGSGGRSMQWRG